MSTPRARTRVASVLTAQGSFHGLCCPANCSCNENEVEIHGHWKISRGKVVFVYISVKKSYQDVKVAGVLCIGGPVMYELKESVLSTILHQWSYENVIPNIRGRFRDTRLCVNLGLALLHACMHDNENVFVSKDIRARVRVAYLGLGLEKTQPVKKIPLCIYSYRVEDQL